MPKFRKDHKDLKPWTIYVWQEGDIIKGAAKVEKDGINELFVSGRTIERDTQWNKPDKKKDLYIARSQTKTDLQNTLNAINWYGKKVLGTKGIDEEKFRDLEMQAAVTASGIHIDISHMFPVKKYPVRNISFNKAKEWGLI